MVKRALIHVFTVFEQSLTNPDKEYSSKKIMTCLSFNLCVLMALADQFTTYKLNEPIFNSFLLLAGGTSVMSIVGNSMKGK